MQDDLLSLILDGEYAKSRGILAEDIHEGKRTLMVLRTFWDDQVSDAAKKHLIDILDMNTTDETLIREAVSILEESGSIKYANDMAKDMVTQAWEELEVHLPENSDKSR